MKKYLLSLSLLIILNSCSFPQSNDPAPANDDIFANYMTWYTYTYNNIKLAQDFIGLDTESKIIGKEAFLKQLATGNFYALKLATKDSLPSYKLYPFAKKDADIQNTAKQLAQAELENYHRIGETFPDFTFTDLNGKVYNSANTKGKTIVLKCWFIRCGACVKEFPVLNKLVEEYKNRTDIVFISLAYDAPKDLAAFIKAKPFSYPVVPVKEEFIEQDLRVTAYPTHMIIDKNNRIVFYGNEASDLIPILKQKTK